MVRQLQLAQGREGVDEGDAAAGNDALLHGGPGGLDGVLHSVLALLQLRLGSGTNLDDGDAADQLAQPLLQLLAVPIGGGLLDSPLYRPDAPLDGVGVALALDDGGVLLGHYHATGTPQVLDLHRVQLPTYLLADDLAAGNGGEVAQVILAAVAEAGGLDGADVEGAAQPVDGQGGQRLAVAVVADDQEVLAASLEEALQDGQNVVDGGEPLIGDKDVGLVFDDALHALGVGDEVGAYVAAVEVHPLDVLHLGVDALGLLDGDDAVLAHLLHDIADELANVGVVVGGDGGHLGHLLAGGKGDGIFLDGLHDGIGGLLDAALEGHGVGAGGHVLEPLVDHGLGEDGGGGGAVAGDVVGLGGHLFGQLGADILERILQLHVLGDGYAVVGDGRGAELLLQDDVASPGAQGDLDGVGQGVDAVLEGVPGRLVEQELLGHVLLLLVGLSLGQDKV